MKSCKILNLVLKILFSSEKTRKLISGERGWGMRWKFFLKRKQPWGEGGLFILDLNVF